jgi:hypothetical protein
MFNCVSQFARNAIPNPGFQNPGGVELLNELDIQLPLLGIRACGDHKALQEESQILNSNGGQGPPARVRKLAIIARQRMTSASRTSDKNRPIPGAPRPPGHSPAPILSGDALPFRKSLYARRTQSGHDWVSRFPPRLWPRAPPSQPWREGCDRRTVGRIDTRARIRCPTSPAQSKCRVR